MIRRSAEEDEKLLILPLNDSKRVSQVLSNDTARRILEVLAEAPLSASEVAARLGLPLTTVQYNINKLLDAGLVRVERTKYSEKMREVKIYAPARKLVVIVPEQARADRRSVIEAVNYPFKGASCFIEETCPSITALAVTRSRGLLSTGSEGRPDPEPPFFILQAEI